MRINLSTDGDPLGLPVVLINGLFADLHSWDAALPHLQGCRVLRYDGRGQGQSHKPHLLSYDMDDLLADLLAALNLAAWPACWLVGISSGGCIALAAARRFPERVLGVVAADCYDRVSQLLSLKISSWLEAHEQGGPSHRFNIAAPWIWSESMLRSSPDLLDLYREKAIAHEDHAVRALLRGALSHRIKVAEVKQPCLLLAGEEDLLTPPFQMAKMARLMPNARFQTVPGAHASLLEYAETFGDTIRPFLAEHDVD